jgi:hypothetical protein
MEVIIMTLFMNYLLATNQKISELYSKKKKLEEQILTIDNAICSKRIVLIEIMHAFRRTAPKSFFIESHNNCDIRNILRVISDLKLQKKVCFATYVNINQKLDLEILHAVGLINEY